MFQKLIIIKKLVFTLLLIAKTSIQKELLYEQSFIEKTFNQQNIKPGWNIGKIHQCESTGITEYT